MKSSYTATIRSGGHERLRWAYSAMSAVSTKSTGSGVRGLDLPLGAVRPVGASLPGRRVDVPDAGWSARGEALGLRNRASLTSPSTTVVLLGWSVGGSPARGGVPNSASASASASAFAMSLHHLPSVTERFM